MSQLSHFQSPIYYVLTNKAWFVARERNWRRNASTSPRWRKLPTPLIHPLRDEKNCLRPWFTLSAMKKPAYAPDLLLENCDGVVHYKPYADWLFFLALNEKTGRVSGIYPRLYLLKKKKKKWISLVVIRFTFVIRARLKYAGWISF